MKSINDISLILLQQNDSDNFKLKINALETVQMYFASTQAKSDSHSDQE
jgi:hypothetical protein